MSRRRVSAPALLAALGAFLSPGASLAQDAKEECLSAYEDTQLHRMKGEFLSARDAAKTCSRAVCQPVLRDDCLQWLAELERIVPSVVLSARSERGEEVDVEVWLDGEPLVSRLDGAPIELDPGAHTFRFALRGRPPIEHKALLKAGEKLRAVSVAFVREPRKEAAPRPSPGPEGGKSQAAERPVPPVVIVTGGAAVVAGAAFATLALTGRARQKRLEDACAPFCPSDDVNALRLQYVFADISLGIGLASLVTAATLYITRPEAPRRGTQAVVRASFDVTAAERGAMLQYRRRF